MIFRTISHTPRQKRSLETSDTPPKTERAHNNKISRNDGESQLLKRELLPDLRKVPPNKLAYKRPKSTIRMNEREDLHEIIEEPDDILQHRVFRRKSNLSPIDELKLRFNTIEYV